MESNPTETLIINTWTIKKISSTTQCHINKINNSKYNWNKTYVIFLMNRIIFSSSDGPWKRCNIIISIVWTSYLNLLFWMHVKNLWNYPTPLEELLYVPSELVCNSWSICTLSPRNNLNFCNSSVTTFAFIITMSSTTQIKTSS